MARRPPRDDLDDVNERFLPTVYPPVSPISPSRRKPISSVRAKRTFLTLFLILLAFLFLGLRGSGNLGSRRTEQEVYQASWRNDPSHAWTIEDLREMVKETKGYYARDWSLSLGWNNMRYIIEAGLLHAAVLNRTLVLPSFFYLRRCEFSEEVCAAFAEQVDRFTAVNQEEEGARQKDRRGWKIPIEYMLDLPHLRASQPVVLTSEYLTLQGLDPSIELTSGIWGREAYSNGNTLYVIPNDHWDGYGNVRVDRLPHEVSPGPHDTLWTEEMQAIETALQQKKGGWELGVMEWEEVRQWLRGIENVDVDDEGKFLKTLNDAGLTVLYSFAGARNQELIQHVTEPIRQVARRAKLRGLVHDYGPVDADVVLLEGETHLWRKAGSMRFTTEAGRAAYQRIVLQHMRPHPKVVTVGNLLADRVREKVGRRSYFASHMRRGDFLEILWAAEYDIGAHLKLATDGFARGRVILQQIKANGDAHVAPVPNVTLDQHIWELPLPLPRDSFFLATDERRPAELDYCRSQGALFTDDIITVADRRVYGWPFLFGDMVMLVEQIVMSQAAYFYGYGASSVSGGVLNQRAARGMDPRTSEV